MIWGILLFTCMTYRISAQIAEVVPDPYIVNGNDVPEHITYPFVALQDTHGVTFCGGTLIRRDYVLTAAHCSDRAHRVVYGAKKSADLFAFGEGSDDVVTILVKDKIIHPDFKTRTFENDIALLELSNKFSPSISVASIDAFGEGGNYLRIVGFGVTHPQDMSRPNTLQHAKIGRMNCPIHYTRNYQYLCENSDDISCTSFCGLGYDAWGRPVDACYGDSGGPVYSMGNDINSIYIYGITSWGVDCAMGNDYPGVYTLVGRDHEWIENHTKESENNQNEIMNDDMCEKLKSGDLYNSLNSKILSQDGIIDGNDFFLYNMIKSNRIDTISKSCIPISWPY